MLSVVRGLVVIAFCVALNFAGIEATRKLDSLLFLDLVGTAIASLVYGPILGILVGFLTNAIAELFAHQPHYFLFAIVQAISALFWGLIPRLAKGAALTNFLNDDLDDQKHPKHEYDYSHLFWGLILFSFVSHLLASLTIGVLMHFDQSLFCSVLTDPNLPAGQAPDPDKVLCDLDDAIFGALNGNATYPIWQLATAKALIGWPDHLLALSFAVLMVAHFLPKRRYKMQGPCGSEMTEQTTMVRIVFFVLVGLLVLRLLQGLDQPVLKFLPWIVYLVVPASVWLLPKKAKLLAVAVPNERYGAINRDLEHAFEDSLRLGMVLSVIIYVIVSGNCSGECKVFGSVQNDKVTGAVGVAFIIIMFRYLSIIIARSSRPLRNFLRNV